MPVPPLRREQLDGILDRLDTTGIGRRDLLKVFGAAGALAAAGAVAGGVGRFAGEAGASVVAHDKVAILTNSRDSEYSITWEAGGLAAAGQLGLRAVALDAHWNATEQVNQFDQISAQQYGSAILLSTDGAAVRSIAKQADRTGTYISSAWDTAPWYTPWDSGGFYAQYTQADEFTAESQVVEKLLDSIGGAGTVIRIAGAAGSLAEEQRRTAALEVLSKYPKVRLAASLNTDWSPQQSQQATGALLSRFPDTVGVIAVNDDVATGAVAAIRGIGKVPGKDILVVGANGSNEGINRVADGTQLATTGNSPAYCGFQQVTRLYDMQRGWTPDPAERMLQWRAILITDDNVAGYQARFVHQPPDAQVNAKLLSRVESPDNWDTQFLTYPIVDLERQFVGLPKPPGWSAPQAWIDAEADGSFERITALYRDHFRTDPLKPTPDNQGRQL